MTHCKILILDSISDPMNLLVTITHLFFFDIGQRLCVFEASTRNLASMGDLNLRWGLKSASPMFCYVHITISRFCESRKHIPRNEHIDLAPAKIPQYRTLRRSIL